MNRVGISIKKLCSVALISSFMVGCAQLGISNGSSQSSSEIASKIKIGKTSRQKVVSLLGEPDSDNIVSGNESMVYSISDNVGKAGKVAGLASSVMSYIPGLSSYSSYVSEASSQSSSMSHTKTVTVSVRNNIVTDLNIIGN